MEHAEATDRMAAARYLLDEMTEEERFAFEERPARKRFATDRR